MCKVGCAILSILTVVSAMSLVGEVNRSDLYIQNNDMPIVELVQSFSCEPKYCRDMRSCTEAVFHYRDCGHWKKDGIEQRGSVLEGLRDNIPCENVCGRTYDEMDRRLREGR